MNGLPEEEWIAPGHRACAGCGCILSLRHVLKGLGKNAIITMATGCMEVVTTPYPQTAWRVPWIHVAFENAAAVASGVSRALKVVGREDVKAVAIAGDGGTADIGLQALSGAVERGENIL
ncbi:MAG: thiamine pyrophosphate-dependent enzyme, partial [Candidatus Hadarchaeales archaeon]